MSCNYILKNVNICKNYAKKSIKSIEYCTRHYNILIQTFDTTPSNTDTLDDILLVLNIAIYHNLYPRKRELTHI